MLSAARKEQTREEQTGFCFGCSFMDQILTPCQLFEMRHIYEHLMEVVFLDIPGAFNSVQRNRLF